MGGFLIIISLLAFVIGLVVFSHAKNALHEIEAGILFIISATYFIGGCIVNEISSLRKDRKKDKINNNIVQKSE